MNRSKACCISLIVLIIFFIITTLTSPLSADKVYRWTLQGHTATGDVLQNAENLAKAVDMMSNGRLKIRVVAAGTIVPTVDTFDAVSRGTLDMTHNWGGYWMGWMPEAGLEGSLPAILTPDEYRHILYERGALEVWRKAYAKHNIMWFPSGPAGADTAVWSKTPLTSIADIEKTKLRSGGTHGTFWAKMGAATVFMPMEEIYTALAVGTVDGVATAMAHMINYKHNELCKYVTLPSFMSSMLGYLINMKKWNELPDDLKAILTHAIQENYWEVAYKGYVVDGGAKRALMEIELMEKQGVKFLEWDDEVKARMAKVSQEMFDEFATASPIAKELVEIFRGYLKEVGRLQ